jgi:hypothetical protein
MLTLPRTLQRCTMDAMDEAAKAADAINSPVPEAAQTCEIALRCAAGVPGGSTVDWRAGRSHAMEREYTNIGLRRYPILTWIPTEPATVSLEPGSGVPYPSVADSSSPAVSSRKESARAVDGRNQHTRATMVAIHRDSLVVTRGGYPMVRTFVSGRNSASMPARTASQAAGPLRSMTCSARSAEISAFEDMNWKRGCVQTNVPSGRRDHGPKPPIPCPSAPKTRRSLLHACSAVAIHVADTRQNLLHRCNTRCPHPATPLAPLQHSLPTAGRTSCTVTTRVADTRQNVLHRCNTRCRHPAEPVAPLQYTLPTAGRTSCTVATHVRKMAGGVGTGNNPEELRGQATMWVHRRRRPTRRDRWLDLPYRVTFRSNRVVAADSSPRFRASRATAHPAPGVGRVGPGHRRHEQEHSSQSGRVAHARASPFCRSNGGGASPSNRNHVSE